MRVRGSKRRVHLTEVDLEPTEQKPMLRIAPAAASMIWLGSIALATAIYMEWVPARALFESETRARPAARAPERPRVRAAPRSVAVSEKPSAAPPSQQEAAPVRAEADSVAPPPEPKITTPAVVPESSRTIRGSYYSEDSNWAGGW